MIPSPLPFDRKTAEVGETRTSAESRVSVR